MASPTGFFASEGTSSQDKQFIFVNRRFIRSSKLAKVVRKVFKGSLVVASTSASSSSARNQPDSLLPKPNLTDSPTKSGGKSQPVFCFFLKVPPSMFDITFHPRKTELEFDHSDLVSLLQLLFRVQSSAFCLSSLFCYIPNPRS